MKTLTTDQLADVTSETTSLCKLVVVEFQDGTIFRYTDHDTDVIGAGGNTHLASIGCDTSEIETELGTSPAGLTLTVALLSETDDRAGIKKSHVESGAADAATVTVALIDFNNSAHGATILYVGRTQTIVYDDDKIANFTVEPLLTQDYSIVEENYSLNCRADLGDARCTVDIDGLKADFAVTTFVNRQKFYTDLTSADGEWDNGLVVFTSGKNNGFALEVATYLLADGSVQLALLLPFDLVEGDTGTIYPGCNKTTANCKRYNNIVNFRGEPFVIAPETTTTTAESTPATPAPVVKPAKYPLPSVQFNVNGAN